MVFASVKSEDLNFAMLSRIDNLRGKVQIVVN